MFKKGVPAFSHMNSSNCVGKQMMNKFRPPPVSSHSTQDFEEAIAANSSRSRSYTSLVKMLSDRFHRAIPGSEVSVDVAWKPGCVDGRCYDYSGIARAADLVFGEELGARKLVVVRAVMCVQHNDS